MISGRSILRRAVFVAVALAALLEQQPPVLSAETKRHVLSCSPTVLTENSTPILRLFIPHPSQLAVEAPDGGFYPVVYDLIAAAPGETRLKDEASFRQMTQLRINVSSVMGPSRERVFQKSGKYRILLADVLYSDADQDLYKCSVTFRPRP